MALETTLEPWYPAPARCNRCFDVFPSKNKASEHAKIAGHLPADIVRICTDCGEMFGKNSEQRKHADLTGHMNGRLATGQIAVPSAPFSSRTSVGSDPPVPFASAHVSAEDSQVAHSAALTTSGCPLCGQEVPVDRVHVCHSPAHQSCPICLAQFESNAEVVDHITNASSCSTCKICLPPSQQLEDHYWDSLLHPKCRPCALAFKDHDEWGAHKINCPVAPRKGQKAKQVPVPAAASSSGLSDIASNPEPPTPRPATPDAVASTVAAGSSTTTNGAMPPRPVSVTYSDSSSRSMPPSAAAMPSTATPHPLSTMLSTSLEAAASPEPSMSPPPIPPPPRRPLSMSTPSSISMTAAPTPFRPNGTRPFFGTEGSSVSVSSFRSARELFDRDTVAGSDSPAPSTMYGAATIPDRAPSPSVAPSSVSSSGLPSNPIVARYATNGVSAPVQPKVSTGKLLWRCRSCSMDPVDPVTMVCGHVLCYECALREIRTNLRCPACKHRFLIRIRLD